MKLACKMINTNINMITERVNIMNPKNLKTLNEAVFNGTVITKTDYFDTNT